MFQAATVTVILCAGLLVDSAAASRGVACWQHTSTSRKALTTAFNSRLPVASRHMISSKWNWPLKYLGAREERARERERVREKEHATHEPCSCHLKNRHRNLCSVSDAEGHKRCSTRCSRGRHHCDWALDNREVPQAVHVPPSPPPRTCCTSSRLDSGRLRYTYMWRGMRRRCCSSHTCDTDQHKCACVQSASRVVVKASNSPLPYQDFGKG